jgi:hypothetical protein
MPVVGGHAETEFFQVDFADYLAASKAVGGERPTGSTDGGKVFEWLESIGGRSGSSVYVPIAPGLILNPDDVGSYRDEVGFAISDVDAMAALSRSPESVIMLAGDLNTAASTEVVEGVFTLGEGDDFTYDLENRTPARPLGRPLRFASQDAIVLMSQSTEMASAWLDPEAPRLSDDADLLAVARVLDERNVVGATVIRDNFSDSELEQMEDLPAHLVDELVSIKTPFQTVGIGWAVADGEAEITVAYVFADEAAAETARSQVETAFTTAMSFATRGPIADKVVLVEATVEGRVVVADLELTADGSAYDVLIFYSARDTPFLHGS